MAIHPDSVFWGSHTYLGGGGCGVQFDAFFLSFFVFLVIFGVGGILGGESPQEIAEINTGKHKTAYAIEPGTEG